MAQRETTAGPRAPTVMASLAVIAALYAGREVLVPVALALTLVALLWPAVTALHRRRMPVVAASALCVIGVLCVLVALVLALESPVRRLARDAPHSVMLARAKVTQLAEPLRRLGAGAGSPVPGSGQPD